MTTLPVIPPKKPLPTPLWNDAPWTAVAFALGILLLGMIPPALLFSLDPDTPSRIGIGVVPIPAWVFTGVWLVIYPGMGIATWIVWQRRGAVDVSMPIIIFMVSFVQNLSFWLSNSIRMIAVIDATGLLLSLAVTWVYYRYDQRTIWFLLPWIVWMPITLGFKLLALAQGAT